MISVAERGSLCSGRNYLPDYIERIPVERRQEICKKLANSHSIDMNSLSSMMEDLSVVGMATTGATGGSEEEGWVTRVNSTNVLDEGLRIGEIGRRMNSKVRLVEIGVYRK
jgi:hypothetical protein